MLTLSFVVRYKDANGVGVAVDNNITVNLYEDSGANLVESRTLGQDENTAIVQLTDTDGVFYRTTVDVTNYLDAPVKAEWKASLNGAPLTDFVETKTYPKVETLTMFSLREQVLTFLGYPSVGVELSTQQFNSIVKRVMDQYNRFVGLQKVQSIDLVPQKFKYEVQDAGDRGVFRVDFIRRAGTPLISDPLFGREYPRGQQLDFDQYVLGIAHWKTILRVTSQEPEWYWDQAEKTLVITLGNQDFTGVNEWLAMAYYSKNITLEEIPSQHHRIITDYATALAKRVLARVRGKYSGTIPAPGGNITMDADALNNDAKEEIKELDEQLRSIGLAKAILEYG